MGYITDIIDSIKSFVTSHLKIAIIVIVAFFALIIGLCGYSTYMDAETKKHPIVSIEAECTKEYDSNTKIETNDIVVTAKHKNNRKTNLSADEYVLSKTKTDIIGKETVIEVKLKNNNNITCNLVIKTKRDKILGFPCGYPDVKNVVAVLYSNGELCFEGEGDVLISDEGEYAWNSYEESDDYPITAVSFEKGVKPTNMNYWFRGCDTLTYIDTIPDSVITMIGTFERCSSLVSMPDFSKAVSLLDMTRCFRGCEALKNTTSIPENVNNLSSIFSGCTELLSGVDVTNAKSVINFSGAYEGCSKISDVAIPENARNISGTFKDCINLKVLKNIPVSVENMDETFYNCTSLTTVGTVPSGVINMSSTFKNCSLLQYQIIINANPEKFSGCFGGSSVATSLNLAGDSKMLDVLANTNDSGNLTVFGNRPNANLQSRSDVFSESIY